MSTPSVNPPSLRFPFNISGKVHPEVEKAIRWTFNGLTNHEQAFAALNEKVGTGTTTTATPAPATTIVTSTENITVLNNSIGVVNNQTGNTSYTTLQSDYGAFIILNDASPIAITLSTLASSLAIQLPWYTNFINQGAGAATLTPFSGLINGAATLVIAGGAKATVVFDGTNFFA